MSVECLDNFALNVRARTKESLHSALAIAFANAPGGLAEAWSLHPKFGMVLFWHRPDEPSRFQGCDIIEWSSMDLAATTEFVWEWLQREDRDKFRLSGMDARYEGQAMNQKAFRVYVEDWGHVGDARCAIAAILPVWAWLGK